MRKMGAFTCVRQFKSRIDADIAKSRLEAEGIASIVSSDDAGGMYPPLSSVVGLQVRKKDAKKAKEILVHLLHQHF